MNEINLEMMQTVVHMAALLIAAVMTAVVIPFLKKTVIPWMEERHIYELVRKFVSAAEKLAQTGKIQKCLKKEYVVGLLEKKGVTVTPEVDAVIESVCREMDLFISTSCKAEQADTDENGQ